MNIYRTLYEKNEDLIDFSPELITLRSSLEVNTSYAQFVSIIKNIDINTIKKALLVEEELTNKIKSIPINLVVNDLIPIQSEISIKKFLIPALKNENGIFNQANLNELIKFESPIVVIDKKYIIDGHHRWAKSFIANPDSKINCISINAKSSIVPKTSNPFYFIKLVKLFSMCMGKPRLRVLNDITDIRDIEGDIEDTISHYVNSSIIPTVKNKNVDYFNKIIQNNPEFSELDAVVEILSARVKRLIENLPEEGTTKRNVMPDIGGIEEELINHLDAGKINLNLK